MSSYYRSNIMKSCLCLCFLLITSFSWAADEAEGIKGQLNLNTASVEELMLLPFLGESRAKAIIELRRLHGTFKSPDDVLQSDKIGRRTYEAIKPYLKLQGSSDLKTAVNAETKSSSLQFLDMQSRILTRPGEIELLADSKYFTALHRAIKEAERRIDIIMYLFKATDFPQNRAAIIRDELIGAAARGVRVKIILEKSNYNEELNLDNQEAAQKMAAHGILVRFDSPETTTHTKAVIIDGRYVFLGSHNLTHSALERNHEVSLLLDSRTLADELLKYMEQLQLSER